MDNTIERNTQDTIPEDVIKETIEKTEGRADKILDTIIDRQKENTEDLEAKEILDDLKDNNYDYVKTKNDYIEKLYESAYKTFIDANMSVIKNFVTSDESVENLNSDFDIEIEGVKYHWKPDFFEKFDSFKYTGENNEIIEDKLFIINSDYLKEKIWNLPDFVFQFRIDAAKESIEAKKNINPEEDLKVPTVEFFKDDVYSGLIQILGIKGQTTSKNFNAQKMRKADVSIIDIVLEPERVKEYLKKASETPEKVLAISTKSYIEKFIKRVVKDYKKIKVNIDTADQNNLKYMVDSIGELFGIVYINRSIEKKDGVSQSLKETVEYINKNEKDKYIASDIQKCKNTVARLIHYTFQHPEYKPMLTALSLSIFNKDIEDSYILKKLFEVVDTIG